MNAEFQWWLLILGIVIGGALVYLVLAELQGDGDDRAELGDEPDPEPPDEEPDPAPIDDEPTGRPVATSDSGSGGGPA